MTADEILDGASPDTSNKVSADDILNQASPPPSKKFSADDILDGVTDSTYQFTPPPAAPPSIARTAAGTVARNIAPLVAAGVATKIAGGVTRAAGARLGAMAGAGIGALVPGADLTGVSEGIGGVIGGLVGYFAPGFVAQIGAQKAQEKIADVVAPESEFGTKQTAAEDAAHPWVGAGVGLLTIGRPNPLKLVRAGQTIASTEGRAALTELLKAGQDADEIAAWRKATPVPMQKGVGDVIDTAHAGAINAAFNVAGQIQSGQYSATELAKAAAEGTLFNSPWIHMKNPATPAFDAAKQQNQGGTDAIQQSQTGTILQREPGGDGTEGGQRGRVEQGQQGQKTPAPGQAEEVQTPGFTPPPREEVGSTFADIGRVAAMTDAQFAAHTAGEQPGEMSSATRKARELGATIQTPQEVKALQGAAQASPDPFRRQFFNEALQAVPPDLRPVSPPPSIQPAVVKTPPAPTVGEIIPPKFPEAAGKPIETTSEGHDVYSIKSAGGNQDVRISVDPSGKVSGGAGLIGYAAKDGGTLYGEDLVGKNLKDVQKDFPSFKKQTYKVDPKTFEIVKKVPPEPVAKEPVRDWDLYNENLRDNLDSFSPARHTGKPNYELQDLADRFVAYAKANAGDKPPSSVVSDFAKSDEAKPAHISKLRQAVKSMEMESAAKPELGQPKPGQPENVQPAPVAAKPVAGLRARKVFSNETEINGPDILSWIADSMRMMSKSVAKASHDADWWQKNKSLYDDAAPLKRPHHNVIYGGQSAPDQVADAAYRANKLKAPDVSLLWHEINEASKGRVKIYATQRSEEIKAQQQVEQGQDWRKATKKGKEQVTGEDLDVGAEIVVDGQILKVTDKNEETGDVTLEDGSKFGIQQLEGGEKIWVEKIIEGEGDFLSPEDEAPAPVVPKLRPSEKGTGDLLQDEVPFNLAGEKAVDVERIAREKAEKEAAAKANDEFQKKAHADLFAQPPVAPSKNDFPPKPDLPKKPEGGKDVFTVFHERTEAWKAAVSKWLATKPENRAIIWEQAPGKYGGDKTVPGNVKALTPNIGDPKNPWRITTYYPKDGKFMPAGHQVYPTRVAAMDAEGGDVWKLHGRMPGEVMTEKEIQGWKEMSDVPDKSKLVWYYLNPKLSVSDLAERLRGTVNIQKLVRDSFADGKIAFTEPLEVGRNDEKEYLSYQGLTPVEAKSETPEPISAAVRTKKGAIVTGNSHDEIHNRKKVAGEEGFILPDGSFITRAEAADKFNGRQHSHEFEFGKPLGSLYEQAAEALNGMKPREFERRYAKEADAEVKETKSEFLKRLFCSGKFGGSVMSE